MLSNHQRLVSGPRNYNINRRLIIPNPASTATTSNPQSQPGTTSSQPSSTEPPSTTPTTSNAPSTTATTSTPTSTTTSTTTSTSTRTTDVTSAPSSSVSVVTTSTISNGFTIPVTTTSTIVVVGPSSAASNSSTSSTNGALIGGVVGGVVGGAALLALALVAFIVMKRRKERTGSAYFLCFGSRPEYGEKGDLDHSAGGTWPTFDPTSQRNHGSQTRRSAARRLPEATLPDVQPDEGEAEQIGSEVYDASEGLHHSNSMGSYAHDVPGSPRAEGQHSASHGSHLGSSTRSPGWSPAQHFFTPDYSHLDPPEVREARARDMASAPVSHETTPHQRQASTAFSVLPGSGNPSPPLAGAASVDSTGMMSDGNWNKSHPSTP